MTATVSTTDGETASQLDDDAEVDEEDVSVEGNEEDASVEGNEEDDVAEDDEDEDEDEDEDVKEDDDEDNDEEDDDEEDDDEEDDDEEDVGSGGRGTLNGTISETVPSERGRGVVLRGYSLETGWSSRYSCPSTGRLREATLPRGAVYPPSRTILRYDSLASMYRAPMLTSRRRGSSSSDPPADARSQPINSTR